MRKDIFNIQYDVIIIGGGITGIISAAMLSKRKRKVLLVERTGEFGGMFKMIERAGEEFYFGAHHIAGICEDSTTGKMLKDLGINIEEDIKKVTHMRMLNHNKEYLIPLDLDELKDYIKINYPNESNVDAFFELVRQYQTYFKKGDDKGLLRMFIANSKITYWQLLKQYFENDEIIKVLTALGPGYGGIGAQGVAFNNLSLLISYSLGSGYLKKGNTKIIEYLVSIAKENGCLFLLNTECVDVNIQERQMKGIVCKRGGNIEEYKAENVLFTSYPFNILEQYLSGSRLQKKLEHFKPGTSVIRVCGLLDKVPDSVLGDTVYMGNYSVEELDDNIFLEENSSKLPICMIYIYMEEKKVKFMFTFLTKLDNKMHISENYLLTLIKNEFPKIATHLKDYFVLYDNGYKAITNTEWGSVFGWQRTPYNYMNTNIYTPRLSEIKGVYVAGNWATDYGVYGAFRTARKACEAILDNRKEKK